MDVHLLNILGHLHGLFGLFYELKASFLYIKSSYSLQQLRRWLPVFLCPRWSFFSGQTSLFWVSELILKPCTARTRHLSGWVFCVKLGVLNSLWEPRLLWKTDVRGKLTHYHRSHPILLTSAILSLAEISRGSE